MTCRARIQSVLARLDRCGMRSDARGRRYAAAALSDCSRPRPAPHSSSARYRRPNTRALRLRPHLSSPATTSTAASPCILRAATAARPRGGCALVPARAPARQPLPPPARSPVSTTSARPLASAHPRQPTSRPVRVPACWITHLPSRSSRHSSACAPACMLTQPPTQPLACKPPPRPHISHPLG